MGRLRALWACASCMAVAIVLLSCANLTVVVPPPAPHIVLPAQFQWRTVNPGHPDALSIPTTATRPGPAVTVSVTHEAGVGAPIEAPDAMSQAIPTGQRIMATELAQLTNAGWQQLFTPTVTGSFPQYVLYATVRSGSYYCFVEFTASALTRQEASQQLDVYHN